MEINIKQFTAPKTQQLNITYKLSNTELHILPGMNLFYSLKVKQQSTTENPNF